MAKASRYELVFNWVTRQQTAFTDAVFAAARRHRIKALCVRRSELEAVRRRLDRGRVRIGVLLNTQGDGTGMDGPVMQLCRTVKARGGMVVEDPDDAPVYSDRALQFEYLRRAGIGVPRHFVLEGWQPGRPALPAGARSVLSQTWAAMPATGLDRRRTTVSSAQNVSPTLARAGFRPGQKILIHRAAQPASHGGRELRLRAWHLFGQIIVGWRRPDTSVYESFTLEDAGHDAFSTVIGITRTCARISGLDWFMIELVVTGTSRRHEVTVVEPPNALAGLGPGVGVLSELSADIMRLAAERIVEVAWRQARGMELPRGTTVSLA